MIQGVRKITSLFVTMVFVGTALFSAAFPAEAASGMPDMIQHASEMEMVCDIGCPGPYNADECVEHCLATTDAGNFVSAVVQRHQTQDVIIEDVYPFVSVVPTDFSSTIPPPLIIEDSILEIILKSQKRE